MGTINRGPWGALIDDDGSNLTGSIWNKAAIATVLLDPIEAAIGVWIDVPFTSADFTAQGGTWTVAAGHVVTFTFTRVGNTLLVALYLTGTGVGGTPTHLQVRIPGGFVTPRTTAGVASYYNAGIQGTGVATTQAGQSLIGITRDITGTAWSAAPTHILATLTIPIVV